MRGFAVNPHKFELFFFTTSTIKVLLKEIYQPMKQKVLYKVQILSSNLENMFHVIISKWIGFIEVQNIIQYDSINKNIL